MKEITIEVWGDFAAFNAPYAKVERLTYPFPTPSAARGILSAIYMKPKEFRWQINRIEVLNPIRYISFKRNEIKYTVSSEQISTEEERTQRQTTALQDVRYRIAASIIPRTAFAGKEIQLYEQALRRIRNGKCFHQPELGMREFVCYFEESDGMRQPIDEIYLLFQHEYSANFLFTLWKRMRKYGACGTGLTQNVDDLLQSHTARTMLANSEFLLMLNQASTDRIELARLLNISDNQLSYISGVDFGHGLLKCGSTIVPFVDHFPKNGRLYQLMTTKLSERVEQAS